MKRRRSMRAARISVHHDAANGFTAVHEVEAFVDPLERQTVSNQIVDVDLALHVPIDDPRHIGAAAGAAECGSLPDPSSHQLKRAGTDLGAGRSHADDDALAPAAMTALERLAHQLYVADALEAVIGAA